MQVRTSPHAGQINRTRGNGVQGRDHPGHSALVLSSHMMLLPGMFGRKEARNTGSCDALSTTNLLGWTGRKILDANRSARILSQVESRLA